MTEAPTKATAAAARVTNIKVLIGLIYVKLGLYTVACLPGESCRAPVVEEDSEERRPGLTK